MMSTAAVRPFTQAISRRRLNPNVGTEPRCIPGSTRNWDTCPAVAML
jgi:hypothetical protein